MANHRSNREKSNPHRIWLIIAILVAFILLIAAAFHIKKANEKLSDHLADKRKTLNDLYARILYYRKLKVEMINTKKKTTIFLRCLVSTLLLLANGLYIWNCHPDYVTIQHVFECIANFNAAIFFLSGIVMFAIFGSFLELKTAYHTFQTKVLRVMFKRDEETIDSILKLDLLNLEAIRKEIADTEKAISNNESLLEDILQKEPVVVTMSPN